MSNRCIMIPSAPNGEPSKLFNDLKNYLNDRELTKRVWGFTQTKLFQSEFTDLAKDENGEPTLQSVVDLLALDKIMNSSAKDRSNAIQMGLMDAYGNPKSFDLAQTALAKADEFNGKSKTRTAVVERNEDGAYETRVLENNALNIAKADRNKQRAELNTALIELLHRVGFDMSFIDDASYSGIFDPLFAEENAGMLKEVIRVSKNEEGYEAIPEEVAHLVLAGLQGNPLKSRIDAVFTDALVRQVLGNKYDEYKKKYKKGKTPLDERLRDEAEGQVLAAVLKGDMTGIPQKAQETKNLFVRFWNWAKKMLLNIHEEDIDAAIANARNAVQPVADLIRKGGVEPLLDKEQIMAHERMYDLSDQTQKIAEITQEGEIMLSKKLHILQNSTTEEDTKALRGTIKAVRKDLENQRYALACYRLVNTISQDIKGLMKDADSLHFVFDNSTNLNLISSEAGLVNRMTTAVQAYTPYLETLATLPDLVDKNQIAMDKAWAEQVANLANEYLGHLHTLQKDIRKMRFSVLKQLISLYYGDGGEKPEGFQETDKVKWESVDMILSQAKEDISWWDTNLFSAGDSKNPLINVIHKIVVTQQAKRNNKINKLCMKMQEADRKLKAAGYDSNFIYQYDENGKPTGYYAAPIDMYRYEQDRKAFMESIDREQLDYYEIQRKINDWEEKHLEEVPVGKPVSPDGSRRTERRPKQSIYEVKNFQEGWSKEQKEYYDTVMEMKAELDSYLPVAMQSLYTAPQVRKSVTQMFDKDGNGAIKTLWGQWKQRFSIVDDNMDYGKTMIFDFEGKPIKQVPIYFVHMLDDRADLSTDGTHAMFNYISMTVNYSEMGQLANAMRLMQQHVKTDYDVVQTDAGKPIIDRFKALGRKYEREYTETGTGTNVVKAIDTYIDRMFFNETKKKMGNWKHPFNDDKTISKDSVFNIFMYLTSVGRMGLNVLSGITNATQGETQMLCEAMAGRFFNMKDLAWAKKEYGKLLLNYIGEFNSANRHDKMYMLINQFNSSEDFFRDMMDKDFNKGAYKRVLGRGNIYFLNTMGEHYLHTAGMLMVLKHEKVIRKSDKERKPVSLYDVIKEVHDENGYHLELEDDIEFVDKNRAFLQTDNLKGKEIITKEDRDALFENLAVYINKLNADMHGGYSEAEKGNANQVALWRAILQFRQWMFGMYNKAYAGSYYDAITKTMREGGYRSISKFIIGTLHDCKNMSMKQAIENNQLTYEERQNARVALAQSMLFVMLCVMCKLTAGWKDDDDRDTRLLAYSLRRLQMETGALVPWPPSFIKNIFTLIQSPAAGVNTLQTLSGIFDLNNLFDEVGSGRYKGWNKALKAVWTTTPLYNIQKLIDMKDYNYMFNIFK